MISDTSPPRSRHDLLITGGRAVTPEGVREVDIAVDGGKVTALLERGHRATAAHVRDVTGCHVLPGLIDSHVHFRTPGLTHKEDWPHGSRAAAAGGVTTVIDMPNTQPPLLDPAKVSERAELVAGRSLVDFRFHLGTSPETLDRLKALTPQDATSVKIFMAGHHTAPNVLRSPSDLRRAFEFAAGQSVLLVLHAEADAVFALLDAAGAPPAQYRDYERARPRSGGIVAVTQVIELVQRYGTHAHILHVSSAEEVQLLIAARRSGLPISFELTGHHLSFTAADSARQGARLRLSPSIRSAEDQEALWAALLSGEAGTLGSDHAPHTVEEKTRGVAQAPPGIPGVQELATAVFTGMRRRQPEAPADRHLVLLAEHLARRPAELFGLAHRKGSIVPGLDADLVVFDADRPWMVTAADLHTKAGWSAYEGWTMAGRVLATVRRGEVIWDQAEGRFGSPVGVLLNPDCP
ncbi:dihydroorotase [Nonomuraea helvata]|uniref:Dihydroorotase family protein n=1 Tax=Nonomuraea helvata TaxID=37484 RepID=A0ABV5SAF2_9ACTN